MVKGFISLLIVPDKRRPIRLGPEAGLSGKNPLLMCSELFLSRSDCLKSSFL